ncbi:MAG: flagellar export chaperone FliS [Myxococcota bacterium]
MLNPAIHRYKSVQVKTSSPGELLMLLYDGCFRFLHEAMAAIDKGERARAGERLDRAHAILGELVSTLRHEVWPELCANLESVYMFCMGHIVQANLEQSTDKVKEVIDVLDPIRSGFREAVRQVVSGEAAPAPPRV